MLDQLKPYQVEYQDGSSRNTPPLAALSASALNFEQRGAADWLRFAQEFSSLLHYYNENNQLDGLWDGFLLDQLPGSPPDDTALTRAKEQFRKMLIRYLDGQLPVNATTEVLQKLQAPHRTLFLTFVKLLEEIKQQFNLLPQRHLDFHFRELLGLEGLPPMPDSAHIRLKLVEDADELVLPPGTKFLANPDDDEELIYELDHMLPVNQTSLESLLQIYLEKNIEKIADIRNNNYSDEDGGFLKLMEFALGESGIATSLPALPVIDGLLQGEETLEQFHQVFQQALDDKLTDTVLAPMYRYVEDRLFMTWQDFDYVLKTQDRSEKGLAPYPNAWENVYDILRRAYLNKQSDQRRETLRSTYNEAGLAARHEAATDSMTAFNAVLQHAFAKGEPAVIADYDNQPFQLAQLLQDLDQPVSNSRHVRARNYLLSDWFLTTEAFDKIRTTLLSDTSEAADWDESLILLEQAMRKCQGIVATEPSRTDIGRLYHHTFPPEMVTEAPDSETNQTYPLFGNNADAEPLTGWQIQSPLFVLKEGRREVTCFLRLRGEETTSLPDLLKTTLALDKAPFLNAYWLVDAKEIAVDQAVYSFGNYLLKDAEKSLKYKELIAEATPKIHLDRQTFDKTTDTGNLLLLDDGRLFEITEITGQREATLQLLTQFSVEEIDDEDFPEISVSSCMLFDKEAIFYSSIKVQVDLPVDFAPLELDPNGDFPVLNLDLNKAYLPDDVPEEDWKGLQNLFRSLILDQVLIRVAAYDLKIEALQNDYSSLDAKKPFLPFGEPCEYGNSCYFTHDELVSKPLSTLDVKMHWPQVPASFKSYYGPYGDELNSIDFNRSNSEYKARLSLKDRYKSFLITDNLPLFDMAKDEPETSSTRIDIGEQLATADYQYEYLAPREVGEVLDAARYFTMEYQGASFFHEEYRLAQAKFYAKLSTDEELQPLPKPYVPKLKSLHVSYTAEQLLFENGQFREDGSASMVHKLPFGTMSVAQVAQDGHYPLVYPYGNSGELYFGLKNALPGNAVSLLFQLSEGTTTTVTTKPKVHWYYLQNREWKPLSARQQLLDHTNGLTQTGIKIIQLPRDIANDSEELPQGLCWLKAVVPTYSESLPKFVAILSGAGHVTLQGDAPASHYQQLLPAESITQLEEYISEIASVSQPFPSSKGRPAEDPNTYYDRVSKRLRHKNRALTMWDYEQLVLQQFPAVFKVKCLSADHLSGAQPGSVSVLVIPDVRGQVPFTPLKPRLPGHQLANIQQYLQEYAPAFANVQVANPDYKEIKVRLGVKLLSGYQEDLSKAKLVEQIKQFLSPWAYDVSEELSFGGEIYANTLIGYIENLPYVDYLSNVKLFERKDDGFFYEIYSTDGMLKAVAGDQKTVIVSAEAHVLDIIGDEGYVVEQFTGINFNKIELDFRVGDP